MKPRVLVAEDRPSVLELLATILEGAYAVTTAGDGLAALSLLETSRFHVVLTDVRMPGANGFEVLSAVQRHAPETAVVMMTAYSNVPDAVAAIEMGAFDYLMKPLDADEISLVVARAEQCARERSERRDCAEGSEQARSARVPDPGALPKEFHRAAEETRAHASREYLTGLLRLHGGDVTHAAARAGMTRESLRRVLKKYGVRHERADERERDTPVPGRVRVASE